MLETFCAWRTHTISMLPPNMRLYTVGSSFLGVRSRRGWGRGHAAARRVGGRHGASAGAASPPTRRTPLDATSCVAVARATFKAKACRIVDGGDVMTARRKMRSEAASERQRFNHCNVLPALAP